MLKRTPLPAAVRRAQQVMVLLVALVVLVSIMVAGISMMRSVDTATLVTGNLAFQQAATHAADKGIEAAMTMLQQKNADNTLDTDDATNGYFATLRAATANPVGTQSWQEFWNASLAGSAFDLGEDAFKNRIYFVVHRVCANPKPPNDGGACVASPAVMRSVCKGCSKDASDPPIWAATQIYYRITVRVVGPRRTESYVQSHIVM